jgi:hypothetical protein
MKTITLFYPVLFFIFSVGLFAQKREQPPRQKQYSIEQAISERAQLHTMAFSGLAFITGNFGADCFFPPGKVADFFGFQYMRDNDKNEMGHNTDFLTRIANNVIHILNLDQLKQFVNLANLQAPIYDEFALKRMILIKAFRTHLEEGTALNKEDIIKFGSSLYSLDAELSYNRALVYGSIANSIDQQQKEYLAKLDFNNSDTWPILPESLDKRIMSHWVHVSVMTYASEFYSWYAGSETADVYFCPERHATYFGGFYLKDYPAMGNKGYNISTALTGDKGKEFIGALTTEQSSCLNNTIEKDNALLKEIVNIRKQVSVEFRKVLKNEVPDREKVFTLIKRYGEIDAEISFDAFICFAAIKNSLSREQKDKLYKLRNLDVYPEGCYLYSDPIDIPVGLNCDFLLKK